MQEIKLPVMIETEMFLYPFMITPLFLTSKNDFQALKISEENNTPICILPSKEHNEILGFENAYDAGVIGNVMRKVVLPDGRVKILFQGSARAKIKEIISREPMIAKFELIDQILPDIQRQEALLYVLKEKVKNLSIVNHMFSPDLLKTIEEGLEPNRICDLICSALRLRKNIAYELFIEPNLETKILKIIDYIGSEIEASKLQKEIRSKVHSKIDKTNKEYFLKEQLKEIQKELGSDTSRDEEIAEYRQKLDKKKPFMSQEAYKEIDKQLNKFSRMHPEGSEASMTGSYLDWALDVPFGDLSKDKLSIKLVQNQLDKDHFGLLKPKKRIVEYFGLKELLEKRKLTDKVNNGVILCFVGPPGVGKTSLANSIAKALKRKLIRIALGGLEDVNELRGHRRTYIGAMPGRIVQGLIEAKTMNPVVVLDEIDKLARSYRGDPTAVLLEILDPEQNSKFRDYYLNFNIDLSKVIFVATANETAPIPAPLRDRMEFIELSSYTPQEKFEIAKRYLIPQELEKHGLKASEVNFAKPAVDEMIEKYTRESGVRNLRHRIADILRQVAIKLLNEQSDKITITNKNLKDFLDKKVFEIDVVDKKDKVGIVNGLAWTAVGGDVLKIEAIRIRGKGSMQITGQLGDVMKESAQIAFSLVKTLIDNKKIKIPKNLIFKDDKNDEISVYNSFDLHIHVPEGATPKDGPSAGITMTTAIASILSDIPIRHDIAMTGEITLSGKVLPIGGLKEKLIAAHKAKIKTALIPRKNYDQDLKEIPDEVKNAMQILPVDTINDVLNLALK
nr:endopeptidase La [Campylobacter sp.]